MFSSSKSLKQPPRLKMSKRIQKSAISFLATARLRPTESPLPPSLRYPCQAMVAFETYLALVSSNPLPVGKASGKGRFWLQTRPFRNFPCRNVQTDGDFMGAKAIMDSVGSRPTKNTPSIYSCCDIVNIHWARVGFLRFTSRMDKSFS